MFYCDNCAKRRGLKIAVIRSLGPCDLCDRYAACSEAELPETVPARPAGGPEPAARRDEPAREDRGRILSFAEGRRQRERKRGRPERSGDRTEHRGEHRPERAGDRPERGGERGGARPKPRLPHGDEHD